MDPNQTQKRVPGGWACTISACNNEVMRLDFNFAVCGWVLELAVNITELFL